MAAGTVLATAAARSQDATWLASPGSGDFDTGTNWTPATVPTGTAFFGTSNTTTLSFSATTTAIGGWTFNAGASNYTFNNTQIVNFSGAGIVINGGSASINNDGIFTFHNASTAGGSSFVNDGGGIEFFDTSTAGSATISSLGFGQITFHNSSTAGSANITNGTTNHNNAAGTIAFEDSSTAGSATITNNSIINFFNTSTAGTATITNNNVFDIHINFNDSSTAGSATINNVGLGVNIDFNNTSTAGSATITNNALAIINFNDTSSAGSANFTNEGEAIINFNGDSTAGSAVIANNDNNGDGALDFTGGSTAGSATITNNGVMNFEDSSTAGSASIVNTSVITFLESSTAGSATITNSGTGIGIIFDNTSTAGSATIDNSNVIAFNDTSTAGSADITNSGAGTINFNSSSTAGSATITNSSVITFNDTSTAGSAAITNGLGGIIAFKDTSTAGNAALNNIGATNFLDTSTAGGAAITNHLGGAITFNDTSTAGNATITNDLGGTITFNDTSTAGNATITNDLGGTIAFKNTSTAGSAVIGNGGKIVFDDNSTAGNAALTNTGGSAVVDFSASTGPNGDGKLSAGSIAGGGNFYLGSEQLTVGGNNLSTNVSGVISDCGGGADCQIAGATGGSLVKVGSGTLTLTGIDTYTGATTVNSGTLEVDGTLTGTSGVTINSGGVLTGTGTVDPVTVTVGSAGSFTPGVAGTPGTSMTIAGNLAFQSGALYVVYLNPSSTTFANITGTAALAGTVQANFASGSYVARQYTILQSAGLGGTTFSSVSTTGLGANLAASLTYSADDVFLNLTASLGAGTRLNINQQNVATALDNFFNGGGSLPPGFASVFNLTGTNLANALTALDGENATGAERGAFDLMNEFLGLMLDPHVYGRDGGGPGGAPLGFAPDQAASLPPDVALAYAGLLKAAPQQIFAQRWTTWASGFGGNATASGDPVVGSSNVTTSTYGYAAGMDYHASPDTVFGFSLAGGGTNWNLANALGTGRSDALLAGIYGVTHEGPWYLGGALAFANNWFNTNRTGFAGDQLTTRFQGQSYAARLEGGYRFAVPLDRNAIDVIPYGAIQAQDFHTPAYSETDLTGGGFGLSYNAMSGTDTRSELGSRFEDLTALAGLPLILRAKVAWAHDWVSNPALNAAFESLPGTGFTVFGAAIPSDSTLTSAGAQLFFTPNWSLLAKFDGEFAKGAQTYAGSGTLRYTW